MKDEDLGALYVSTDRSSMRGQRVFLFTTKVQLYGLVAAAIGGAFTATWGQFDLFGLLALIGFLVTMAAEVFLLSRRPEQLWYEGRAAAESVKTLVWRYMMRASPFSVDGTDADVDAEFLTRLHEVLHDLKGINAEPAATAVSQITPRMSAVRSLALEERRALYRAERVEDQRAWYASRSTQNARRGTVLSIAAIALEFAGVLAAALKAFGVVEIDLLGPFAAGAAGLVAWAKAKQHEALARAYFIASQELAEILSRIERPATDDEWSAFVQDSEEAISREHTLWRASRGLTP